MSDDVTDFDDSFDNLSDEEFSKLQEDPSLSQGKDQSAQTDEDVMSAGDAPADPDQEVGGQEQGSDGQVDGEQPAASEADAQTEPGKPVQVDQQGASPEDDAAQGDAGQDTKKAETAVNYEDAYKQIMAPFKANKRDFAPKSPEEAVRLMQMGANYTQKMQALAPNMKLLRMLENHGLLDESKINHMIDLNRKDPAAIQKLLYDGKIDPLDLSTTEEPAYTPGNHSVSDQEMGFHNALNDVLSTSGGRETVQLINTNWDQASKQAIYKEPEILAIINEQRENGIFDRISAEIDRRKILGEMNGVPFIQAYKTVGDTLHAQGLLVPAQAPAQTQARQAPATQTQVVGTRVAAPKPTVANSAAAKAASPSGAAKRTAPKEFDVFAMSDAEIMAHGIVSG